MIKIAFVLTPVDFGGAEKVNLTLLKSIDRSRFDIHPILLIRPWENENYFISELKKNNYRYLTIPVAIKPSKIGKDYFRIIRSMNMLFIILRKNKYDIVHTNGYFADIIGVPISKLLGISHISTCHGFIKTDRKLSFYNALNRFTLRFATLVIAVSESIKEQLINNGLEESNISVIQNAVEISNVNESLRKDRKEKKSILDLSQDDFVVAYIGRLSEEKGIQHLIKAYSIIEKRNAYIRLIIIGDGPDKNKLIELVTKKRLTDKVSFVGFQNDIESWLAAIDIFILPSLTEGTPMALLEAMSFGLPVIASAVGGVPKVIKSMINGILVSPANPNQIADAIIKLYNNDELRLKIARKAAETIATHFSINQWITKIESVYLDIIENKACT